ncbi:hypothetical protein PF010_g31963 [Phytophthora fragariae]|uniref:Uncharacterized protein n=1 Tax=Phytophthora fragariae TaxID=53985 RepID=A0A6G0JGA7_9STRA|nr:hypothetical protein PF010_g31963 [Phytophthora fragariae]
MASGEQSSAPCSAPGGPPGLFTRLLTGHQCDYEEKREECESHHPLHAAMEIEGIFNSQQPGSANVGSNQAPQDVSGTQSAIVNAETQPDQCNRILQQDSLATVSSAIIPATGKPSNLESRSAAAQSEDLNGAKKSVK